MAMLVLGHASEQCFDMLENIGPLNLATCTRNVWCGLNCFSLQAAFFFGTLAHFVTALLLLLHALCFVSAAARTDP